MSISMFTIIERINWLCLIILSGKTLETWGQVERRLFFWPI